MVRHIHYDGVKYDLEEFKQMVLEDVNFFDTIKSTLVDTAIRGEDDRG